MNRKYVLEILNYNPKTGIFTWKHDGSEAGRVQEDGYVTVTIKRKKYKAHRLAWLVMKGRFPVKVIDHKNDCRSDNRWANLQLATTSLSNHKRPNMRIGPSGFRGVYEERPGRFRARICIESRNVHLGYFATAEDAAAARDKAAKKLHGKNALLNYPVR